MNWNKRLRIHIFCWLIFLSYEVVIGGIFNQNFGNFWVNSLAYTIHIAFFYFHSHVLLPYLLNDAGTNWWKVVLLVCLELMVYALLSVTGNLTLKYVLDLEDANIMNLKSVDIQLYVGVLYRSIYFLLLSSGYYFLRTALEKNRQETLRKIQIEQLNTEVAEQKLNQLRAQISPHLLFNTLSFIKYNAKHSVNDASKAVTLLSDILDFAIQDADKNQGLLIDEIEQVDRLIELGQLRFGDRLNINFTRRIHDDTISVLPLALITLVENMFKHGNVENKDNPATIYVETSANRVVYKTSNLIRNNAPLNSNETGVTNIKLRLEKIYPGRFIFQYAPNGEWYHVELCVFTAE